ncbi:MAG: hypothetical protein U1E17_09005 [Geminicoccaceae bacterium]
MFAALAEGARTHWDYQPVADQPALCPQPPARSTPSGAGAFPRP